MLKINPFSPGKISFYTNVPLQNTRNQGPSTLSRLGVLINDKGWGVGGSSGPASPKQNAGKNSQLKF
jgi:hypothetical protein